MLLLLPWQTASSIPSYSSSYELQDLVLCFATSCTPQEYKVCITHGGPHALPVLRPSIHPDRCLQAVLCTSPTPGSPGEASTSGDQIWQMGSQGKTGKQGARTHPNKTSLISEERAVPQPHDEYDQ